MQVFICFCRCGSPCIAVLYIGEYACLYSISCVIFSSFADEDSSWIVLKIACAGIIVGTAFCALPCYPFAHLHISHPLSM